MLYDLRFENSFDYRGLHRSQIRKLHAKLLRYLSDTGFDYQEMIETRYADITYKLPSRMPCNYQGISLSPILHPAKRRNLVRLAEAMQILTTRVREEGITEGLIACVEAILDCSLPNWFNKQTGPMLANREQVVAKFIADVVMLISPYAHKTVIDSTNCYARFKVRTGTAFVGLIGTTPLTFDFVKYVSDSEGEVVFNYFDILDKVFLWIQKINPNEPLLEVCKVLKLSDRKAAEEFMELYANADIRSDKVWEEHDLLYTPYRLKEIRRIWITNSEGSTERYKNLKTELVPEYLSLEKFESLFGSITRTMANVTMSQELRLSEGIEKFTEEFNLILLTVENCKKARQ